MFDVKDCVGFLSNRGGKVIGESMNRYFEERGSSLTRVQWTALYYIDQNPGLSQKQLAEKLQIKEPTLMKLIKRMENENLLVKKYNKESRKLRSLYMTDKGEKEFRALFPLAVEFNELAQRDISLDDMETFKKILQQIIKNVDN